MKGERKKTEKLSLNLSTLPYSPKKSMKGKSKTEKEKKQFEFIKKFLRVIG